MLDRVLTALLVFFVACILVGTVGAYLDAERRVDLIRSCDANNISLSECDAYWEKTP